MKTSELIMKLEKLKKKYGDLPVKVMDDGTSTPVIGIAILWDDQTDSALHFLIADKNTMDAFL